MNQAKSLWVFQQPARARLVDQGRKLLKGVRLTALTAGQHIFTSINSGLRRRQRIIRRTGSAHSGVRRAIAGVTQTLHVKG